jgi:hypothetical protein
MAGRIFSEEVYNRKEGNIAKVCKKVMVYCCQNCDVWLCPKELRFIALH